MNWKKFPENKPSKDRVYCWVGCGEKTTRVGLALWYAHKDEFGPYNSYPNLPINVTHFIELPDAVESE